MMKAQRPVLPARIASARDLFIGAYPKFAPVCRAFDEPGLAVIAIDEATGKPAGIVKLCARVQRPVAAIVGRHDKCDLFLHDREQLSLRQLAVVVDPVKSWQRGATAIKYRVFDLRTSQPMVDEDGRPLRGIAAEGPAILRCAGYVLFMLVLGDPSDWPADAADAWSMLPERVYLDELANCASGSMPKIRRPRIDVRETYITRTNGPRDTGMRLATGDIVGTLEIYTPQRQLSINVGADALNDGVLLGRYGRCDLMEAAAEDHSLSRVHALLMKLDDRLLLIDTASSNGTFEGGQRARVVVLENQTELRLGKKTFLRWRWG
jgi:pSer/pThr/pTyr-binding forkhead associated (FHA) protein